MLVSVALPLPLFRTFTYEVSDDDATRAQPGARVVVPVRNRRELGIIVGPAQPAPGVTPKRVLQLPDAEPVLRGELLALCRWIAEYYVAPPGIFSRTALPTAITL